MKPRWLSPLVRRVALREWFALFIGLLALSAALAWQNGLGRLDQSLYDLFLTSDTEPTRDDIIIVAIDDYSLAQLGRWPWPRSVHAELIDRLTRAGPRALGLDVILSEPEILADGTRTGDRKLAEALKRNGRAVLPVVMTNIGHGLTAALPIPELANAAQALGHIDLEHDSDGVVRSVFLNEGRSGALWPHFSAALAAVGKDRQQEKPAKKLGVQPHAGSDGLWHRADELHIPYTGSIGHFQSVPYLSVLRGEVPDIFFKGKYVLIGATALGMADAYPTPVSGSLGAMPGIEINAHALASVLDGKNIVIAPVWKTVFFNVLPVFMALLGYLLLSPRLSLFATGIWLLVTLGASYLALQLGIWIAPSAALIVLIISYPLWSWRRLEAAITYLGQEFTRLDKEPHLLPEEPVATYADEMADVLDQRISAMKNAARRVRDLRQFVSDNLNSLPDATLVTSVDGRILLANKHANDHYRSLGLNSVREMSVIDLLSRLKTPQPVDQIANTTFAWSDLLNLDRAEALANGVAVQDHNGRDLLVKSAPCYSAATLLTGWIISILDISTIRAAERSRDETLRFLSHDMRAPQASILALLELQGETLSALPQQEFFARIERASRKTLGLADNFVQLARAESHEYRLEEVDFQELLFDATDEMWSLAKNKRITISVDVAESDYWVNVDRTLMTRALTNLLSNAINYSPEATVIACSLWSRHVADMTQVVCRIRDHGYGIAPTDQDKLFQRFQRVHAENQPRHEGAGLGLVFVKTVIERHHGNIRFTSAVGEGTTFTLTLPCAHTAP